LKIFLLKKYKNEERTNNTNPNATNNSPNLKPNSFKPKNDLVKINTKNNVEKIKLLKIFSIIFIFLLLIIRI